MMNGASVIDATFFGYGVGLVLVGYLCGAVLGVVLDALKVFKG